MEDSVKKLTASEVTELKAVLFDMQSTELQVRHVLEAHQQHQKTLQDKVKSILESRQLDLNTHLVNLTSWEVVEAPNAETQPQTG